MVKCRSCGCTSTSTKTKQIRVGADEDYSFEPAKKKALKHFVHNQEDNIFVIAVKLVLKLNMVANFVPADVSFRQASRLCQFVK